MFTGGELKLFPTYRRKYTNKDYDYILCFDKHEKVDVNEVLEH